VSADDKMHSSEGFAWLEPFVRHVHHCGSDGDNCGEPRHAPIIGRSGAIIREIVVFCPKILPNGSFMSENMEDDCILVNIVGRLNPGC
jgi:hypothetical protein